MLTPQEIQKTTFQKAVFGGYDMEQVDQLLEPLIRDYTTLFKENSVLKEKLKVLVHRLEEIRDQGLGTEQTMQDTQAKCEAMLRETQAKCDAMLEEAKSRGSEAKIAEEEERLEFAKKTALSFIEVIERDIRGHLELLETLKSRDLASEKKPAAPAKPYDYEQDAERQREADREREIVSEIEANLTRQGVVTPSEEKPAEASSEKKEEKKDESDDERPTIKFENLQFGENYDPTGK